MPTIGGNIGTPSGGFWLGVDFYYSQNTEGNYSTITSIVSKVTKNNSTYKPYNLTGKTATLKVEYLNESGSWVTAANLSDNSGYDMRSASTITLVSGSNIKIPHKSNGKQTVRITAYVNGNLSNYYPNGTVTSSVDLTDIPRATTPSLELATVEMGKSIAISLPRAVSTFTHTLQHDFYAGSWTTFAEGVGTSATLSVPTSWASRIPTLESGAGRIRCLTYSGSTLIGEKIVDFTATVPSTVIPSVDKITITEAADGLASKFGAFIQNKSQLKVVSSASGAGGSTISSYAVEVLGVSYTGQDITTYVLTKYGTIDVKVTVTDSRGRKGSKTAQVYVVEYFTPTILYFNAFRSDADGNEKNGSKTLKCAYNFKVAQCGNKNDASYKIEYRKAGSTTWTALTSGSSYEENTSVLKENALALEYAYEVRLTVSDYFTANEPATYVIKVGTEIVVFCPYPTGKGLAVGGYPTGEFFQVFMESEFYKTLKLMDVDGNGTNLDLINTLTQIDSELANVNSDLAKLKTQKVLWSGAYYMQSSQTATLSEAISAQPNGIVLVWVDYNSTTGSAGTQGYWMHYIPKKMVEEFAGRFYTCSTQKWSQSTACLVSKGFYLYDTKLVGHNCSINESATMNSKNSVLCRVYGV